jgi:hypothetical protein
LRKHLRLTPDESEYLLEDMVAKGFAVFLIQKVEAIDVDATDAE